MTVVTSFCDFYSTFLHTSFSSRSPRLPRLFNGYVLIFVKLLIHTAPTFVLLQDYDDLPHHFNALLHGLFYTKHFR